MVIILRMTVPLFDPPLRSPTSISREYGSSIVIERIQSGAVGQSGVSRRMKIRNTRRLTYY